MSKQMDLLSDCCKADFDAFGFPRDDGLWQEKCLKCGKPCEPIYQEVPTQQKEHRQVAHTQQQPEERQEYWLKPEKYDWEKDFDKWFGHREGKKLRFAYATDVFEEVKEFIREIEHNATFREQQRIREALEKRRMKYDGSEEDWPQRLGYNTAIEDILSLLPDTREETTP